MIIKFKGYDIEATVDEAVEFMRKREKMSKLVEPGDFPPPKQKPKKDLDMGKVKALREAGWSLAAIGDEMKVSPTTIANKLKLEQEEVKE